MPREITQVGDIEICHQDLAKFLVEAKRNCYAGSGQEERLPDGAKRLTFENGPFHYTDEYAGSLQAPGTEIVRWKREDGQRIWQMSYAGGVSNSQQDRAGETIEFLKKALTAVSVGLPYRGPPRFERTPLVYDCNVGGDITSFHGEERIIDETGKFGVPDLLFYQRFIGGFVIPKPE